MKIKSINREKIKALTGLGLLLVSTSLVGCKPNDNVDLTLQKEAYKVESVSTYEKTPTLELELEEITKDVIIEDAIVTEPVKLSTSEFLTQFESPEVVIGDTTDYSIDHIDRLIVPSGMTEEEELIAKYAYQRILESNIDINRAIIELNNLMVEQIVPRCISEKQYNEEFGLLLSTLGERESLYDTYSVLAWLIHDNECDEEHIVNEAGTIECKTLVKEFNEKDNQ